MDNQSLIFGLLGFIGGGIFGYIAHDWIRKGLTMSEDANRNLIILMVTLAWTASVVASLLNPTIQVPLPVHGVMGVIVGFFFHKASKNGGDK